MCACPYLDKSNLAGAHVTLCVSDDHLTIVLQRALLTQDIVDTCNGLIPFIVITISKQKTNTLYCDHCEMKLKQFLM